jgi:hypothetical protein
VQDVRLQDEEKAQEEAGQEEEKVEQARSTDSMREAPRPPGRGASSLTGSCPAAPALAAPPDLSSSCSIFVLLRRYGGRGILAVMISLSGALAKKKAKALRRV